MNRVALALVATLCGCAGDEVCVALCEVEASSSSASTTDDELVDESSSDDEGPIAPIEDVPYDDGRICDPDNPCAALPKEASFGIDHCNVFGGSAYGVDSCAWAWDICHAYERTTEYGVICWFDNVEIRRVELVPGACDEYGEARLCLPGTDVGGPGASGGELD
ncbi:MAG TPA: hypothetical protein VG755_15485 [Nannocystaceae bacterium]|nr:hypothetical protein [Nannocystaceae bacterium]